jgi:hypothetical protein
LAGWILFQEKREGREEGGEEVGEVGRPDQTRPNTLKVEEEV